MRLYFAIVLLGRFFLKRKELIFTGSGNINVIYKTARRGWWKARATKGGEGEGQLPLPKAVTPPRRKVSEAPKC